MTRYHFLGVVIYYLSWVLSKTIRIQVVIPWNHQKDKQYLCAFWHGKQFLPPLKLLKIHNDKLAAMVSPSKDGDIIAAFLEKWGYKPIRGSSRRDAIKGSLATIELLQKGYSIGFAVDGPIGPIHKVKPGVIHMAKKFDLDIVPIGVAYSRKWTFSKAWDKFELPKPFSKAVMYLGMPFTVEKTENTIDKIENTVEKTENVAQMNCALEARINDAELQAKQCL